jgi:hypothetical protein
MASDRGPETATRGRYRWRKRQPAVRRQNLRTPHAPPRSPSRAVRRRVPRAGALTAVLLLASGAPALAAGPREDPGDPPAAVRPSAGAGTSPTAPDGPSAGDGWTAVAGGEGHSCALRPGGSLWCWGENSRTQLALPLPTLVRVPVRP